MPDAAIAMTLIGAIYFPEWLDENALEIGRFSVKWYGLAYIVGWALALWVGIRTVARRELFAPTAISSAPTRGVALVPDRTVLEDFAFWLLIGIIVGGRLGSAILYQPEKYLADPLAILRVWEGGMAFHGGFLGVCAAIYLFARAKKLEIFRLSDIASIGAPIGLGLGRLANFVNQELWGRPTDVPWAFIFNKDMSGLPRHPSQLYEAALEGALLFAIIFWLTRKRGILAKPGIASGVFIGGYGLFRFFVEFFREPDPIPQVHEYFTRGMAYSLPMIVVGALMVAWAVRRPPAAPRFMADAEPARETVAA